jgi:hypothetical protein
MTGLSSLPGVGSAIGGLIGGMGAPGAISNQVPEGPNKLFCGGLPYDLGEVEIKELLAAYGPLKGFHLVRERNGPGGGEGNSKGFAFFEYLDPVCPPLLHLPIQSSMMLICYVGYYVVYDKQAVSDVAIAGLNGIEIGGKILNVRRTREGLQAASAMPMGGIAGLAATIPGLMNIPGMPAVGALPGMPAAAALAGNLLGGAGLAALGLPTALPIPIRMSLLLWLHPCMYLTYSLM